MTLSEDAHSCAWVVRERDTLKPERQIPTPAATAVIYKHASEVVKHKLDFW